MKNNNNNINKQFNEVAQKATRGMIDELAEKIGTNSKTPINLDVTIGTTIKGSIGDLQIDCSVKVDATCNNGAYRNKPSRRHRKNKKRMPTDKQPTDHDYASEDSTSQQDTATKESQLPSLSMRLHDILLRLVESGEVGYIRYSTKYIQARIDGVIYEGMLEQCLSAAHLITELDSAIISAAMQDLADKDIRIFADKKHGVVYSSEFMVSEPGEPLESFLKYVKK